MYSVFHKTVLAWTCTVYFIKLYLCGREVNERSEMFPLRSR